MKLFQRLLVAPAALGLMAPVAATAADLNINDVSSYSDSVESVKSLSEFSDVYPTDWAYQALTNLADRHSCLASPSGSMTRYEAAALLNKCLENVAQVNDEERRLLNEFGPELAVINGRLDGLESRVGEFEAGAFSTTTKLKGKTSFVIGAMDRGEASNNSATTFTYSTQFDVKTSFTGKDMLYHRIKTGNFEDGKHFEDKKYGAYLVSANDNGNSIEVDKLWYEFPVGDQFRVWVGPEIENYYMLASAPSIYKPMTKQFALGGNGATYGASTAQGFGAAWIQEVDDRSQPRFAVSTNYVAASGEKSDAAAGGGLMTDNVANWLTKFEYGSPRWQVSFAVAQKFCNEATTGSATPAACFDGGSYYSTDIGDSRTGDSSNYALRAYWKPDETGAIPAIQIGYDIATVDDDGATGSVEETAQWMLGFMWKDAFIDGNTAGIALGQRQYATERVGGADDPADDNFVWEAYYDFKVSDNITVTPAIFGGEDTFNGSGDDTDDVFGGLVQTTFKF